MYTRLKTCLSTAKPVHFCVMRSGRFLLFALLALITISANAVEIVRVSFEFNGAIKPVDIELFDTQAPMTVANYLSYVNRVDDPNNGNPIFGYDDTFITRSEPGFVLQTGGAIFRPPDPDVNALIESFGSTIGLSEVVDSPLSPVVNEFNQSNLRGTVAMARIGGIVNSATKEWFINLKDNSFLDTVDEGFTVFGRIVDDGMDVADEISALPIKENSSVILANELLGSNIVFNLPVSNDYVETLFPPNPVFRRHAVMINTIRQITRPIITFSSSNQRLINLNFPFDEINDNIKQSITVLITNTGNEDLTIDTISSLAQPFALESTNCSGATLVPVATMPMAACTLTLSINTITTGNFNDALVIGYSNAVGTNTFQVTLPMDGEDWILRPY